MKLTLNDLLLYMGEHAVITIIGSFYGNNVKFSKTVSALIAESDENILSVPIIGITWGTDSIIIQLAE